MFLCTHALKTICSLALMKTKRELSMALRWMSRLAIRKLLRELNTCRRNLINQQRKQQKKGIGHSTQVSELLNATAVRILHLFSCEHQFGAHAGHFLFRFWCQCNRLCQIKGTRPSHQFLYGLQQWLNDTLVVNQVTAQDHVRLREL